MKILLCILLAFVVSFLLSCNEQATQNNVESKSYQIRRASFDAAFHTGENLTGFKRIANLIECTTCVKSDTNFSITIWTGPMSSNSMSGTFDPYRKILKRFDYRQSIYSRGMHTGSPWSSSSESMSFSQAQFQDYGDSIVIRLLGKELETTGFAYSYSYSYGSGRVVVILGVGKNQPPVNFIPMML